MRRWFALSGLCHGGILVALIAWPRSGTPAPVAPIVFQCEGAAERADEIAPREPDPEHADRERTAEEWLPDPCEVDRAPSNETDIEFTEPVRMPESRRTDPRQLNVRLRKPLRTRRPEAPAAPAPVPASIVTRGETRAPALCGDATRIPYPRRARRRGLEGTVELRILLDRQGCVRRVVVLRSSGHAILDEAAQTGVARWRFTPALRDGDPVEAWIRRTIHFRLRRESG